MKAPFTWITGLLLGAVACLAQAATPTFTVTWPAPTQYEDGSTIVGAITYQLYVGPKGAEVKYKTPVTSPPYILVPTPGPGVTCAQVTATVGGVESARSGEACGTVAAPIPKPPATVVATVK